MAKKKIDITKINVRQYKQKIEQPLKESAKERRAPPEKKGIDKGKAVRILAVIVAITIIAVLLAYYFPKEVLEVKSVEEFDKPVGNVEVWVWDRNSFEGNPEKVFKTDENGIARIKLFRGDYAVALEQELSPDNEPPVKYITFLEIKRGKTFSISLAVTSDVRTY